MRTAPDRGSYAWNDAIGPEVGSLLDEQRSKKVVTFDVAGIILYPGKIGLFGGHREGEENILLDD